MNKAVAYLRVSSMSQVEGHSLDAQERLFREACKTRGWEVGRVYREEGRSAHAESMKKRPVLQQLLADAAKGHFNVVVVHTLDRWSRNLRSPWRLSPCWRRRRWTSFPLPSSRSTTPPLRASSSPR